MRDMTKDAAAKVIQGLLSASGELNETLRLVQAETSEDEFEDFRRRTAEVMAALYLDLIKPIVSLYPDLDPGREEDTGRQG
jgi:hypothetical protein